MNKTIAMIALVFALLMNLAGCSKVQSEEPVNMALVAAIADGETILNDSIEDMLITLGKAYHIIRPMAHKEGVFLYAVFDRNRANLALARRKIQDVEKALDF